MRNASREIHLLLRQINQRFFELVARELCEVGITAPQLIVLRCFKGGKRLRMSDLSKQVGLSNSTVCGIVDRLEERGYVRRSRDEEDRRVVWVQAQPKAAELKEHVPILQDEYSEFFLSGMTEEDTERLIHTLTLFSNHLLEKLEHKK
ncbi:MarR family winged helix-turn-helix transcriptional regulator [Aneurinibacillus uraniidurans]|uniref:MarR family winged helix-turn-helix transcriptional regulator n=1 Tax=Aneurinibacillus uraniidurans TaxID=2966586 RepID=UPI002349A51E|nr:MarR family transcriptional regulator [Aneurinibacillus sp. B1]WCN38108.1 MarR family transcriptional regulator [Aneurinibacillus sp. B1]